MAFDNSNLALSKIEELEHKYLMKYWYFLKFVEDELIRGISSMDDIRNDWEGLYGGEGGTSQFDVGCERIVYALLNGKIAGQPNSAPVSSDLFFEVEDAFIHIDLKTVTTTDGTGTGTDNISDFNTSIFIAENQNSYSGTIPLKSGYTREYKANLPTFYTKANNDKKITLTYFVCLLNNSTARCCELISIMCMPNGKLESHYKLRPLRAGKNTGKARFNFSAVPEFELLSDNKKRVRIIHKNPTMSDDIKNKLSFYLENFDPKIDE